MILYQLAKWMEEHSRLRRTIRQAEGDVSFLLHKKEQVEVQLLSQANKWLESSTDAPLADVPPLDGKPKRISPDVPPTGLQPPDVPSFPDMPAYEPSQEMNL